MRCRQAERDDRGRERPSASPRLAQRGGEGLKSTTAERRVGGEAETEGKEEGRYNQKQASPGKRGVG